MPTGILHCYNDSRHLNLFEHLPRPTQLPPPPPKSILLFIGGMFDNFLSPSYTLDLAALFPLHSTQSFRLIHVQLSSASRSFGIFSIDRDIEEISQAITFLSSFYSSPKIILMGHSTGCQDTMHYLTAPNPLNRSSIRPKVQGAILQAPVSDRDSMLSSLADEPVRKAYEQIMDIVQATPEAKYRDTILPMDLSRKVFGPAPMSISRFLSLASPGSPENPSAEDFFSKDLSEERLRETFGMVGRNGVLEGERMLVLLSDSDEFAGGIDQKMLLERWKEVMRGTGADVYGESDVILNALHDVGGEDWPSQEARLVVLRKKILMYLRDVVGGVDESADEVWRRDSDRVMALKAGDGRKIEDKIGVLKL